MTEMVIRILADGTMIPIVLIAGYALLLKVPHGHRFEVYSRIVIAGLTSYMIAKFLAMAYQPVGERPFEILGVSAGAAYLNNPGFPSDHALFAAFLTLAVWFETSSKRFAYILVGLTVLVCIGRVVALVHTPLDVIGGVVVACIGALWYVNDRRKV